MKLLRQPIGVPLLFMLLFLPPLLHGQAGNCNCTDYLYLNDTGGSVNATEKFRVNPDGSLTEIGDTQNGMPWLDADGVASAPHGVAADLNGFLYIGSLDDEFIKKFTCDGQQVDADPSTVAFDNFTDDGYSFNHFSRGNLLYVSLDNMMGEVAVYDLCTGAKQGCQSLGGNGPLWGLTEGPDGMWYGTRFFDGIYRGSLDPGSFDDGSGGCGTSELWITTQELLGRPLNFNASDPVPMGITFDDEGFVYVALSQGFGFQPSSYIVKIDPDTRMIVDQSLTDDTTNPSGPATSTGFNWAAARGIVFSEASGMIYASTLDDCIAAFDKELDYQFASSVQIRGQFPKGIGIVTECCPNNPNEVVNIVSCINASTEQIFLNEIFPCSGTVCEAQWEPADTDSEGIFEQCNLSIRANAPAGCYSFTRTSAGGGLKQCGNFSQTLNVEIVELDDFTAISADQGLACGVTPASLSVTTTGTVIRWESNTISPLADDADWTAIANSASTSYQPPVLSETTYFRAVLGGTGPGDGTASCPGGDCELASGVVTVMLPGDCPTNNPVSCNCQEYIYLNEPFIASVLKFRVDDDPAVVELTEVVGVNGGTPPTQHWYPGTGTSQLANPHGLAFDLNGNLYITEDSQANSDIRRLNCDGAITPTSPATINFPYNMYNMFSIDNTLYTSRSGGPAAYDFCSGNELGTVCLNDDMGNPLSSNSSSADNADFNNWGLSYNPTTERVYVTGRGDARMGIHVFTRTELEAAIPGSNCFDPLVWRNPTVNYATLAPGDDFLPNNILNLHGVVSDNSGNIYVTGFLDGSNAGFIIKYNSTGEVLAKSVANPAFELTFGITYSETLDRLYIANLTDNSNVDCISAFDASDLTYLGAAAPNPNLPANNSGKALTLVTECCPDLPANGFSIDVCGGAGEQFFLNEEAFPNCDGVVCGSSWSPISLNGATFEPCDNSVTITGPGCSEFTLDLSEVVSTNCPAQTTTFTICNSLPPLADIATTDATCDPGMNTPLDNAEVNLTNVMGSDVIGISVADGSGNYTGPAYNADPTSDADLYDGSMSSLDITDLMSDTDYVVRLYNGSNDCFTDYEVTTPEAPTCTCTAGAPSVTAGSNCGPGLVNLSAASGANCDELRWYEAAVGGSPVNTGTTFAPTLTATTSYFVACYNTAQDCESSRVEVIGTIDPIPTIAPTATCDASNLTYSIAVTTTDATMLMSSEGTVSGTAPTFTVSGITAGVTTTLTATNGTTTCSVMEMVTSPVCIVPTLTLGSTVFIDNNNDGVQNGSDAGIPGVEVQLWDATTMMEVFTDANGVVVADPANAATVVTDGMGNYLFSEIPAGDYYVVIPTAPTDTPISSNNAGISFTETDPDDDVDNDDEGLQAGGSGTAVQSGTITLALDTEPVNPGVVSGSGSDSESAQGNMQDDADDANGNMTLDFGFFASVTVGDTAFVDLNNDGLQSPGEPGLGNVTATIYDNATGMPVDFDAEGVAYDPVMMTAADGSYLFENLPPGDYYVVFDITGADDAEFFTFTTNDVNGDGNDADDSDADPTNGQTPPTGPLLSGAEDLSLDVGVACNVMVTILPAATICSTQPIDLTQNVGILPASLGGTWSSSGNGTFVGGTDVATATAYNPSQDDIDLGAVTLTLTTDDPAGPCEPVVSSVTFMILKVDCGSFPWGGE